MSSSEEDKPPAPPIRLTSNRGLVAGGSIEKCDSSISIDRPLPKEPSEGHDRDRDRDRKKKSLKAKIRSNKLTTSHAVSDKPKISYPTNFEHTVHVGFDAITGEFTVSIPKYLLW